MKKKNTPTTLLRRDLIKLASTTGLLTLLGGGVQKQDWHFLQRTKESYPYFTNIDDVVKNCVALTPETPVVEDSLEYRSAMESLNSEDIRQAVIQRGFDQHAEYKARFSVQIFGMPEEEIFAKQLMMYCMWAHDFLYYRLKGLKELDINWTIIKRGEDYSKDFDKKGLLGNSYYPLTRLYVHNSQNPSQNFLMGKGSRQQGGFSLKYSDEKDKSSLGRWSIFMSDGPHSITNPLSEILHLAAYKSPDEKRQGGSMYVGEEYEEAMVEAVSYHLGFEATGLMGIPNGAVLVEQAYQEVLKASPLYRLLPPAVEWIKRQNLKGIDGVQSAFNIYMENPEKFAREISSAR